MVQFGKKAAVLTAAGVLAAMSVTGCSGSIDTDAVVATVGDEDITLGVANFYARMMQGQYETYYAGMMGTTAEEMWSQDAGDGKTYEESMKDSILESLENMYIISQHAQDYEVTPVSYTHLDVYKRQMWWWNLPMAAGSTQRRSRTISENLQGSSKRRSAGAEMW